MTKNVLLVAFSAFFADMGYQSAIALFPIFLVTVLGASASTFGLATAAAFGIGSFFGYLGGLMSSRFNDKKIAILGNSLIPLISLMGLTSSPLIAAALFSGGWWARNFRSPSRRVIFSNATTAKNRAKAFGFLHALDIGGGALSIVMLLALILMGIAVKMILLLTIIPLVISTMLLFFIKEAKTGIANAKSKLVNITRKIAIKGNAYKGIIIATSLYGFSSYTFGFPILTISHVSNDLFGIGAYGVYLGVSAIAGYFIGSRGWNKIRTLSLAGYVLSGLGTLIIGIGYILQLGLASLFLGVVVMGSGFGAIETLEPTLISLIKSPKDIGRGMGALAGSRSIGIFSANLIMGILYVINPGESYIYAATVAIIAGAIVLVSGKGLKA
ncbi:MAG: MFS transporter [Candidatus Micrarchaeaceae archaeon]